MRRPLHVVDGDLEVPLGEERRVGDATHEEVRARACHVVHHRGPEQQVLPGEQEVHDVVLRGADGDAATDAQVGEDVEDLGVPAELLEEGDDDLIKINLIMHIDY